MIFALVSGKILLSFLISLFFVLHEETLQCEGNTFLSSGIASSLSAVSKFHEILKFALQGSQTEL